jgi:cytosine/adenosine deaminase-related metal-dependent hydrolase
MKSNNLFISELINNVERRGGLFNAHLHLGRANTIENIADAHLSLDEKHLKIRDVYRQQTSCENYFSRIESCIEELMSYKTKRADTCVDIFDEIGLESFRIFLALRDKYKNVIDLHLGAYSPYQISPVIYDLLVESAKDADFICSLPDEHGDFLGDIEKTFDLASRFNKQPHFHLDQKNIPSENGTEILCDVMEAHGIRGAWAVHVISPSSYDDARFFSLVDRLLKNDVGVITCPSGAISMVQRRDVLAPTHNCIARVWDFVNAGVNVKVGSDNSGDMLSPATTLNLTDELMLLANATRNYNVTALAKVATMDG